MVDIGGGIFRGPGYSGGLSQHVKVGLPDNRVSHVGQKAGNES